MRKRSKFWKKNDDCGDKDEKNKYIKFEDQE